MTLISFKKAVCNLVLFALIFTQVFVPQALALDVKPAKPVSDGGGVYDLIAVVVDTSIDNDSSNYEGLIDKFSKKLSADTLSERVLRYAQDLRDNTTMTDVKVLFFDKKKESVNDLSLALENLYINGYGTHNNNLTGVVLVGDIPLPVVTKEGKKLASVFPYVDFVDKSYVFNPSTALYEANDFVNISMPEIWHGLITAPNANDMALFFDKNHLYYEGEEEYAQFDKKMFYSNLSEERDRLNDDVYKSYLRYLKSAESLSYMRYNKYWAAALMALSNAEVGIDSVENQEIPNEIPDLQFKAPIDQLLMPYYQVVSRYLSDLNDQIDKTGRWATSDVDSIPSLISVKDEYNKKYLRTVNDALEKAVNDVVAKIQEPVDLLKSSSLKLNIAGSKPFLLQYHDQKNGYYVNGIRGTNVNSAQLCSLYLGSSLPVIASRANSEFPSMDIYSIGVNTRLLSKQEANLSTSGKINSGAAIANAPAYGIPAFFDNPLAAGYVNPLDGPLKAGDVIYKINNKLINSTHTLSQAVLEAFAAAAKSNNGEINIEYYRGEKKGSESFKFTLDQGKPKSGVLFEVSSADKLGISPLLDPASSTVVKLDHPIDEVHYNSCYSSKYKNAGDVILSSEPLITLRDFSDRYGLFDGIDNDGDGIADADLDEASAKYGLSSLDMNEISAKMLSTDKTYTIAASTPGGFGSDITLTISTEPYSKISSAIYHNEPTDYTLSKQSELGMTKSLPIDDPRYASFKNSNNAIEKIVYPNLFKLDNYAQLSVQLDQIAWKIAQTPGKEKLFGKNANASNYGSFDGQKKIHDEVLNKYLSPAVASAIDDSPDGFNLKSASTEKIYDALDWKSFDLNKKYEYVISTYLSGVKNAFVGDKTLFPAPFGYDAQHGYEAAYLAFDGDEDSFNLDFNINVKDETNPSFDPLVDDADEEAEANATEESFEIIDAPFTGGLGNSSPTEIVDGDVSTPKPISAGDISSVPLPQYMGEITKFLNSIASKIKLKQACIFTAENSKSLGGTFDPVKATSGSTDSSSSSPAVSDASYTPVPSSSVNYDEIAVSFDEPAKIEITPESYTLVSNNESKTKVKISLKNKDGEIINNSFFKISLFADDSVYFDETQDAYPTIAGVQLTTFNGEVDIDLFAKNKIGKPEIKAVITDLAFEDALVKANNVVSKLNFSDYISATTKLQIVDDSKLKFTLDKSSIKADGKSFASIKTELVYNNNPIKYNGPITFKLLNPNLGHFVSEPPSNMINGSLHEANVKFVSSTSSGVADILVTAPGFASDTVRIFVGASNPSSLSIGYEKIDDTIQLVASILDNNGNLVTGDNKTLVTFTPTESTKELVGFTSAKSAIALNGKATIELEAKKLTGTVNVIAESDGLKKGTISFEVKAEIDNKMVNGIYPRALYVSLVGGGAGVDANLAESFVFSGGQVQSVSAQLPDAFTEKLIVGIDGYGKVSMPSDLLTARVATSTDEFAYQKVSFADDVAGKEFLSMFVIPNVDSKVALVQEAIPDKNGIYLSTLGDAFTYTAKGDGIEILSNGIVVANVDKFGRLSLFDESLELNVATDSDAVSVKSFALILSNNLGNQTLITYKQKFKDINGENSDAFVIPYGKKLKSFNPGVYIQMNTADERYSVIESLSGNSTFEPKGIYFVDNQIIKEPISNNGKGFSADDKHMLLFSSGNSVGESNRLYASDTSVVYGDPNVKVKMDGVVGLISQSSGYAKTVGKQLFRGTKDILSISSFDYNNDGSDDILVAYDDGYFRLLQNYDGKFKDRGYLLKVFGGIKNYVVVDLNNDGFDDLIVDGERRYEITNNNGHFERKLIPLAISGEIFDMEVWDMNVDGCSDLVASDEAGNVRIFLNKPDGKVCSGISTNHSYSWNAGKKVYVDVVTDFEKFKDEYPDIRLRFDEYTDESLTYIYSTAKNKYDVYKQLPVKEATAKSEADQYYDEQLKNLGLPSFEDLSDPAKAGAILTNLLNKDKQDSDYDGCYDTLDETDNSLKDLSVAVANQVASTIYKLRCSEGGCFPTPDNKAYFAPDNAPGTAAVAFTKTYPYALFGVPSNTDSVARLYISPTKTLGLGTALCVGTYPTAQCFAVAVPPSLVGGCSKFLGPVPDLISKVKNINSKSSSGYSTIIADGNASTGSDAINISGPNTNINARIPGFPSVITNWLDKQTDEIYNKLLDLPDIYFIYPDWKSFPSLLAPKGDKPNGLRDVLRYISSIPLVQIEGREVLIKVPAISRSEFVKWERQKDAWLKYEQDQIDNMENYLFCKESKTRKVLCDKLRIKMEGLMSDVLKLSNKVDKISNLPSEILKWKNAEAKYATQIACYVDAIIDFMGGYIKRQTSILEAWVKAGEDVVRTFKGWKAILDISVDYQQSCDNCRTDRFSKISTLIDIFAAALPDLPVIPLPKWPDIVFDISQIKTGAKIIWPDLIFQPEPIVLPNLPLITIPSDPFPDIVFDISKLDLPDIPDFPFETLTLPELPDLPAMPFPELPDLPRPPKIPKLPNAFKQVAADLKPILKVACLIKKGQLLVPESKLATEIETLTQPSVQATLAFVKHLSTPSESISYDYLNQVRVEVKTNFGVDTGAVYTPVKAASEELNKLSKDLADEINQYTKLPWQYAIDNFIKNSVEEAAGKKTESSIPLAYNSLKETLDSVISGMDYEYYPSELRAVATNKFIKKDDPLLNRSLAELKHDIVKEAPSDSPSVRKLVELRNSLMAYADGINKFETIDDLYDFDRAIADNGGGVRKFASISNDELLSDNSIENEFGIFGDDIQEQITAVADDSGRLLAEVDTSSTTESAADSESIVPKGFYLAINGTSESVLTYLDEIDNATTLFSDVDGDGDEDLIYTMGTGVYVKYNYSKTPKDKKGKLVADSDNSSISDFSSFEASVQNVASDSEAHKKADLSWIDTPGVSSAKYEIDLRISLNADPFMTIAVEDSNTVIEIANGDYYPTVYSLNSEGERSLSSFSTVISPQRYADNDDPLPSITNTSLDVSLFETVLIDSSGSKDYSGEIVQYYLEVLPYSNGNKKTTKLPSNIWSDVDPLVDKDEDGIKWNEQNNPMFRIGPFVNEGDVGVHNMILHVVDQAGNSSKLEISINVFAPSITLDISGTTDTVASGNISSKSEIDMSLMRKRYGFRVIDSVLSLVPSIVNLSSAKTNDQGKYEISGFDLNNMILVKNSKDEVLAEINPNTGNVGKLQDNIAVLVRSAQPNKSSTYLEIFNKNVSLAKVYLVADSNNDVKIHTVDGERMGSVNAYDKNLDDKYIVTPLASDFYPYPGGAIISEGAKPLAILDTSGNIVRIDSSVTLSKVSNNHETDNVLISLNIGGKAAFDILLKINGNSIILGPKDVPINNPGDVPSDPVFKGLVFADYADIDENLISGIKDLYEKNIIEGVQTENGLYLNPDELATRSEFVKIILKMVCIQPSEDAKKNFDPAVFNDIKFSESSPTWFYSFVKEAYSRGLINGYQGEKDSLGLVPFKPDSNITRAEAVKIILETLDMQGVINLNSLQITDVWYDSYMKAAQNLTPLMNENIALKSNFIITPEEANTPDALVTRADLISMVSRVLEIYNCFPEPEEKIVLVPSVPDNYKEPIGGVYVVPAECSTCPCDTTIEYKADIVSGDILFSVISNLSENHIFSKSNEIKIE